MKKHLLLVSSLLMGGYAAMAQCPTNPVSGDLIISSDITLSGLYQVSGTFKIEPGVTVTVEPYTVANCGSLRVEASKIDIQGNINADYAGYPGGNAGVGAVNVSSPTNSQASLTGCANKDNPGQIVVGGGMAGTAGNGPGAGLAGSNGSNGSGPKQTCENNGDKYGMVPGSGGAGGGGGGSYGGNGGIGGNGGNGSGTHSGSGVSINTAYSVLAGIGGPGGLAGSIYGTDTGNDIDLGSGGAGSGGGGRSFYTGTDGNRGGYGGGAVSLIASDTLLVSGTISANGENGLDGGKGANGDKTADCCGDACNDLGERTLSSGAGGGAGSGAGSGGGILLEAPLYSAITGTLSANGGNGGNGGSGGNGRSDSYDGGIFCGTQNTSTGNGTAGQAGGSGSGGRIKIFTTDCAENILSPSSSISGGASADSGTYHIGLNTCFVDYTSIHNQTNEANFNVFPNPASDIAYIKMHNGNFNQNATLSVYDNAGRRVWVQNLNGQTGNTVQLNVSSFQTGSYIIVLENAQGRSTQKLIKY